MSDTSTPAGPDEDIACSTFQAIFRFMFTMITNGG